MNFKLVLLMCFMVIVVTDAWWWRRRRRRSSSSGSVSGSLNCPGGRCTGTLSGTRTWNNGRTSLGGHVSYSGGGNWGAGVTFTHKFKKSLKDTKKFIITLTLPVCNFHPYDLDDDDKIERGELDLWFSKDNPDVIDKLMKAFDKDADGQISIQEFEAEAPRSIEGCGRKGGEKGPGK